MKQTKKGQIWRKDRIRCKVLTQDGYTNRLFIIKSSKRYIIIVAIQYVIDISVLSLFSDLWLTLCNFIFLFTSFVHPKKERIKQILLPSSSASNNLFYCLARKAYFTHTAHVSEKSSFDWWVEEHDMFHVIRPWNESLCFMTLKNRQILLSFTKFFFKRRFV